MISMKLWNWEHWAGVGLLSVPLRYPGREYQGIFGNDSGLRNDFVNHHEAV